MKSFLMRTKLGLERIVFFSDAVMAIAMTLLAIEMKLPDEVKIDGLAGALWDREPLYISYVISFYVIGIFWVIHHRMFEYIKDYDYRLVWLNLVFLLFITILPFTTSLLGRFDHSMLTVTIYALNVIIISLIRFFLWKYAMSKEGMVDVSLEKSEERLNSINSIAVMGVFALSIPIAYFSSQVAMYFWLLNIPISIIIGRIIRRKNNLSSKEMQK